MKTNVQFIFTFEVETDDKGPWQERLALFNRTADKLRHYVFGGLSDTLYEQVDDLKILHAEAKEELDPVVDDECFVEEWAVIRLLEADVLFVHDAWSNDWHGVQKRTIGLSMSCNDVFAWASSDAEPVNYSDVQPLYEAWLADKKWGPTKWACLRRNEKPQRPVEHVMRTAGVWDDAMENLSPNQYDAIRSHLVVPF